MFKKVFFSLDTSFVWVALLSSHVLLPNARRDKSILTKIRKIFSDKFLKLSFHIFARHKNAIA